MKFQRAINTDGIHWFEHLQVLRYLSGSTKVWSITWTSPAINSKDAVCPVKETAELSVGTRLSISLSYAATQDTSRSQYMYLILLSIHYSVTVDGRRLCRLSRIFFFSIHYNYGYYASLAVLR